MSSSSPRVLNQEQAAAAIGTNYRTLQRWQNEAWFPKSARTKAGYDVENIRRAAIIAGRLEESETGSTRPKDTDATTARKLKLARQAEGLKRDVVRRATEEIRLRVAEGEIIPRIGIEQSFADLLTGIADWCEQLPDVYVSMLPIPKKYHKASRQLLRQLIEQRQHDLADELEGKALARDKDQQTNHG